ncbi:hypothetical protein HWQ67_07680 [Candidatus Magnetobacterium casensis]|uniref:DNA-binding protein n=1 Tax=Candidatus Magnetobacterium casense TaxID=1455061 RepID=A0ABS6RZM0_9BACT|nr:hypothetical protein [Candidatus Magnetobacterium casensis]
MSTLVEKLKNLQSDKRLTDNQFAKLINVSSVMWRAAKKGRRKLGENTLGGVLIAFPELKQDILEYLRRKNGESSN